MAWLQAQFGKPVLFYLIHFKLTSIDQNYPNNIIYVLCFVKKVKTFINFLNIPIIDKISQKIFVRHFECLVELFSGNSYM